ncbi:hypothetical protein SRABI128_06591 [Microbacterium sp. Bi128]|nr:hypothetical protein SRABI128_06591 [Microbacterium sp. Bi128]
MPLQLDQGGTLRLRHQFNGGDIVTPPPKLSHQL